MTADVALAAGPTPAGGALLPTRPDKVQAWHRERLAVVYVRQSTGQQVLFHREFDPDPVRAGRPGAGAGVGRRPGAGHRRRPGQVGDDGGGPGWLPALGVGGEPRPRRAHPRRGDVAAGPLQRRLAPAAGAVRALRHAPGRHRRRVRPGGVQRPPPVGLEGDDVRGRAALAAAAPAPGAPQQGAARGAGRRAAHRLRPAAVGGGGARPGRASAARGAARLPRLRAARHAQRAAPAPGAPRGPARRPGARGPDEGRPGVAPPQPHDAPQPPHEPGLRGGLRLRAAPLRPAAGAAGPPPHRPHHPGTGGLGRPAARPPAGLYPLGPVRAQPGAAAANRARADVVGAARHGLALVAGLVRCGRCGPADAGALRPPGRGRVAGDLHLQPAAQRLRRPRSASTWPGHRWSTS